eukprot:scaffold24375_cov26-Tisochrysis_lutea.AAC.1
MDQPRHQRIAKLAKEEEEKKQSSEAQAKSKKEVRGRTHACQALAHHHLAVQRARRPPPIDAVAPVSTTCRQRLPHPSTPTVPRPDRGTQATRTEAKGLQPGETRPALAYNRLERPLRRVRRRAHSLARRAGSLRDAPARDATNSRYAAGGADWRVASARHAGAPAMPTFASL